MPAFSGLWDGIHGEVYARTAEPEPPIQGVTRVMMSKRGMHGVVNAIGQNAPATIARIDADRADVAVRGGWDYATRTDDAGNQVTITNLASHIDGNAVNESVARVADASTEDLAAIFDTVLNNEYAADDAQHPETAPALAESISDGS